MKALLAIEWLKIRRYRTAWVLSGLFLAFILLLNVFVDTEIFTIGGRGINILNSDYSFFAVWRNTTYWTKMFAGLIALLIVILTTNEYQYRTNRQNIIDGMTRSQFFHAKWLLVLAIAMAITLFVFLLGLVQALADNSSISDIGLHIERLPYLFILIVNYSGFALTLSLFLKRTGLTIVIFILYAYPFEIFSYFISTHPDIIDFGFYLPMESSAGLITYPLTPAMREGAPKYGLPSENTYLVLSLVYITVYYLSGRLKLLKSDW